uniref:Uncharacterized protein n=1 Tax=Brassica oleracea var. oleracea TaxID=109376 RepID=A0A0D3CC90_BRAOL
MFHLEAVELSRVSQLNELALGLAESGKQFIWVIRSPSRIANSSFFNSHSQTDPLPPGFLDRTKGKGFVVPSWAPQVQILKASRNNEYMIVPPKEEVVRVIMRLMEGEEGNVIRNQMKELKERAVRVLREDGLSTKALTEVSLKWKSH